MLFLIQQNTIEIKEEDVFVLGRPWSRDSYDGDYNNGGHTSRDVVKTLKWILTKSCGNKNDVILRVVTYLMRGA